MMLHQKQIKRVGMGIFPHINALPHLFRNFQKSELAWGYSFTVMFNNLRVCAEGVNNQ